MIISKKKTFGQHPTTWWFFRRKRVLVFEALICIGFQPQPETSHETVGCLAIRCQILPAAAISLPCKRNKQLTNPVVSQGQATAKRSKPSLSNLPSCKFDSSNCRHESSALSTQSFCVTMQVKNKYISWICLRHLGKLEHVKTLILKWWFIQWENKN